MYKIMLVDDEPYIIEGLKSLIDWDEYGLCIEATASNGLAALEAFARERVDIIITDIKMPKLDGIGLISKIKGMDSETKYIILSGYGDFPYVKEGIQLGIENYILKPINEDELSATLLKTIEKLDRASASKSVHIQDMNIIKENILNRWATGQIDLKELKERAEMLGLKLFESSYVFAAIRVIRADKENLREHKPVSMKENVHGEIEELCRKHLDMDTANRIFHDHERDLIIPFSTSDITSDMIRDKMKRILSCIRDACVVISIGNPVRNPEGILRGFANAKRMLFFSMFLKKSTIVDYTEFVSRSAIMDAYQNIDLNPLKKYILAGERESAVAFIGSLYEKIVKEPAVTPAFLRDITIEILYNIFYITNTDHIKNKYIRHDMDGFFNRIYYMDQVDNLVGYVNEIVNEVIDHLSAEKAGTHPLVNRVTDHVQENYAKDISLKTLSHLLNVNTAYLGQLFKSETGEIFSNYLNRVRVEKALHLLKTTNISANEVSTLVGFSNPSYFYSIFKKITGMSTIEYKQSAARQL